MQVPPCAQTPLGPLKIFIGAGDTDPHHASLYEMAYLAKIWEDSGAYVETSLHPGGHHLPEDSDESWEKLNKFI